MVFQGYIPRYIVLLEEGRHHTLKPKKQPGIGWVTGATKKTPLPRIGGSILEASRLPGAQSARPAALVRALQVGRVGRAPGAAGRGGPGDPHRLSKFIAWRVPIIRLGYIMVG